MKKENGYFKSADEKNNIHYIIWNPEQGKPIAVIQLIHGMIEHIDRYDEFARFLTSQNIAVIGHDLLGHGRTALNNDDLGFFAYRNGNKYNNTDINTMHEICMEKFPDNQYFILGHSMGSLLLRQYLHSYPHSKLSGAIIMGTTHPNVNTIRFGIAVSDSLCKIYGARHRSRFLTKLSLGSNNHTFKEENDNKSWLTSDPLERKKNADDPFCNFLFTASAFRDMFENVYSLHLSKNLSKMNKKLPILITSGTMDPVGGYSKEVEKVYNSYKIMNFNDLTIKLWKGLRHEILHEKIKNKVFEYIYSWMLEHMEDNK